MKLKRILLIVGAGAIVASCGGGGGGGQQDTSSFPSSSSSSISYDPSSYEISSEWVVSFDSMGGSEVASQTVSYGGYATRPEDPNKDGFLFNGWFKDSVAVTPFIFETTPITANWTLYAGWKVDPSHSSGESTSETSASSSEEESMTIYFKDAGWWAADNAISSIYMWDENGNNNSWPGAVMTLVSDFSAAGGNVWKVELDFVSASGGFIFVRHNPDTSATSNLDWGAKTKDLSLLGRKSGDMYDISSSSATWGNPGAEGVWTTFEGGAK